MCEHLIYGESHADNIVRPALFADLLNDILYEAHPVLEAAAVLVITEIGIWRKELLEKIAVSAVELDTIDAGLLTSYSTVAELLDQFQHFVMCQSSGRLLRVQAYSVGSGYARLASDQSGYAFSAGMMQLDEYLRSMLVNCCSEL